jgi:hypothetical protein
MFIVTVRLSLSHQVNATAARITLFWRNGTPSTRQPKHENLIAGLDPHGIGSVVSLFILLKISQPQLN